LQETQLNWLTFLANRTATANIPDIAVDKFRNMGDRFGSSFLGSKLDSPSSSKKSDALVRIHVRGPRENRRVIQDAKKFRRLSSYWNEPTLSFSSECKRTGHMYP